MRRAVEYFVIDILLSIDRLKRYTRKITSSNSLVSDEILCSAVARELEIIGEAMNHVLASKRLNKYTKPEWRRVVDFRNIVIHEYFGLNFDEVFWIIKKAVPKLEQECIDFMGQLPNGQSLEVMFSDTIEQLRLISRLDSVKYLKRIQKSIGSCRAGA